MFDLSVVGSCWSYCRHVLNIPRLIESNTLPCCFVLLYMFVCLFVLLGLWWLGLIAVLWDLGGHVAGMSLVSQV